MGPRHRLATPVILAAGVLKLPSLAGPSTAHIHGQILVGVVVAFAAAYLSIRYLVRYFQTRTLTPFASYSLTAGVACVLRFSIQGPADVPTAAARALSARAPRLNWRDGRACPCPAAVGTSRDLLRCGP